MSYITLVKYYTSIESDKQEDFSQHQKLYLLLYEKNRPKSKFHFNNSVYKD